MYVVTKKETRTLITIKSGKSNKKRGNMFLKIHINHVNSSEVSPVDNFFSYVSVIKRQWKSGPFCSMNPI